MDLDETRREHNMARWTFAGSLGVVLGPLLRSGRRARCSLSARRRRAWCRFDGWPVVRAASAQHAHAYPDGRSRRAPASVSAPVLARPARRGRRRLPGRQCPALARPSRVLRPDARRAAGLPGAVPRRRRRAPRRPRPASPWRSGLALGLLGDFALDPLLETGGAACATCASAQLLELVLFPADAPRARFRAQTRAARLLGFFNSGWYAILQAQLYGALPGQSGIALAVKNISGIVASVIPLALGLVAQRWGLNVAMWPLLVGPATPPPG